MNYIVPLKNTGLFDSGDHTMGFLDWLLGTPKKKRVSSPAKSTATTAAASRPSQPTVRKPPAGSKNNRIFETGQQQSQARDIVKDWLKEDN
ncbi:MAG: hypothetical protein G8345_11225 [Magnetococcales bacterium]|nr:hypothetical protein [Magnetococcales bacterium]NGZ27444.1 hypothetical protein [Magnetococcales bacterium]